jgi:flagellar biosynthesis/type III secretory pathway M-ring protein FliF/YscJ
MNILRQLWQDAQHVLRDMSVTQRVAVTFLILTVAIWLTFAAWMGTTPGETGRRPLPMEVDPSDVNDILAQLQAGGIESAEYQLEERRVIVNADEEKNAIIVLAEQGLLKDAHAFGFSEMLDRWAFSDTRMKSDEAMRLARSSEVARLIENLAGIRSAKVIYSDDVRRTLFGVAQKLTAAVRVDTKLKKDLTEAEAETIISLVAAAKSGLDPRDVVVTDQNLNKFHTSASSGLTALAKRKWDAEYSLDEALRRKLETLMRQYIPNVAYEGDVYAFPKHEVDFNDTEQTLIEVLPGETLRKQTSAREYLSTKKPNEEPGVQPNARRVANMGPWGYWYTDETRETNKTSDVQMQNGRRETATRFSPSIKNLTISAIIQLPYRYQRDEEGRPVQAVNEAGELLIEPETRLPMWARESVDELTADRIEELKRQIDAAGVDATSFGSDLGQVDNPTPVEGIRQAIRLCLGLGYAPEDVRKMVRINPARVIGLEI